jgi:hypothetical protein
MRRRPWGREMLCTEPLGDAGGIGKHPVLYALKHTVTYRDCKQAIAILIQWTGKQGARLGTIFWSPILQLTLRDSDGFRIRACLVSVQVATDPSTSKLAIPRRDCGLLSRHPEQSLQIALSAPRAARIRLVQQETKDPLVRR